MADSKTSALPAVAAVTDAQEFPVNDGGTSRRATALQIKTYAGVAGLAAANGGTALADNRAIRGDGTSGIQGSGVTISDGDAVAGITQFDVDNLRLDGNTLSSTNANGDIALSPNGTGSLVVPNGSVTAPSLRFADDGAVKTGFYGTSGHLIVFASGGLSRVVFDGNSSILQLPSSGVIRFSSGSDPTTGGESGFYRAGVGELGTTNSVGSVATLLTGRSVEASTAGVGTPNLLSVFESRKLLTNEGAAAEAYNTLPAAAAGIGPFGFYCQNTNGIRATAQASDTIRIEGSVSAAAGFIRSVVVGSLIWLECINGTEWVASNKPAGTWTIDS